MQEDMVASPVNIHTFGLQRISDLINAVNSTCNRSHNAWRVLELHSLLRQALDMSIANSNAAVDAAPWWQAILTLISFAADIPETFPLSEDEFEGWKAMATRPPDGISHNEGDFDENNYYTTQAFSFIPIACTFTDVAAFGQHVNADVRLTTVTALTALVNMAFVKDTLIASGLIAVLVTLLSDLDSIHQHLCRSGNINSVANIALAFSIINPKVEANSTANNGYFVRLDGLDGCHRMLATILDVLSSTLEASWSLCDLHDYTEMFWSSLQSLSRWKSPPSSEILFLTARAARKLLLSRPIAVEYAIPRFAALVLTLTKDVATRVSMSPNSIAIDSRDVCLEEELATCLQAVVSVLSVPTATSCELNACLSDSMLQFCEELLCHLPFVLTNAATVLSPSFQKAFIITLTAVFRTDLNGSALSPALSQFAVSVCRIILSFFGDGTRDVAGQLNSAVTEDMVRLLAAALQHAPENESLNLRSIEVEYEGNNSTVAVHGNKRRRTSVGLVHGILRQLVYFLNRRSRDVLVNCVIIPRKGEDTYMDPPSCMWMARRLRSLSILFLTISNAAPSSSADVVAECAENVARACIGVMVALASTSRVDENVMACISASEEHVELIEQWVLLIRACLPHVFKNSLQHAILWLIGVLLIEPNTDTITSYNNVLRGSATIKHVLATCFVNDDVAMHQDLVSELLTIFGLDNTNERSPEPIIADIKRKCSGLARVHGDETHLDALRVLALAGCTGSHTFCWRWSVVQCIGTSVELFAHEPTLLPKLVTPFYIPPRTNLVVSQDEGVEAVIVGIAILEKLAKNYSADNNEVDTTDIANAVGALARGAAGLGFEQIPFSCFSPFFNLVTCSDVPSVIRISFLTYALPYIIADDFILDKPLELPLGLYLTLLADPNRDVAIAAAKTMAVVARGQRWLSVNTSTNDDESRAIVQQLMTLNQQLLRDGAEEPLETFLNAVGAIAAAAHGELLLTTIIVLLDYVGGATQSLVCAAAVHNIRSVAVTRYRSSVPQTNGGYAVRRLFEPFQAQIWTHMIEHMQSKPAIVAHMAALVDADSEVSMLRETLCYTVPYLIRKRNSDLLDILSKTLNENSSAIVHGTISHVYVYLFTKCEVQNELPAALQCLLCTLKDRLTIEETLKAQRCSILKELVFLLGAPEHPSALFAASNVLYSSLEGVSRRSDVVRALRLVAGKLLGGDHQLSNTELADFLQPYLLAILTDLTAKFLARTSGVAVKYQIIEALIGLMRLIGPAHLYTIRAKAIAMLRMGIAVIPPASSDAIRRDEHDELVELQRRSCHAWLVFIRILEPADIGSLFSEVVVAMFSMLDSGDDECRATAVSVLRYLVIDNGEIFRPHFRDIYILHDAPELADVNEILRAELQIPPSDDYSLEDRVSYLRTQLELLLKGVSHENTGVRQMALTGLRALLFKFRNDFETLIVGTEAVDPIITCLIAVLLRGTRDAVPALRSIIADCIGGLGAIAPGRLPLHELDSEIRPQQQALSALVGPEDDAFVVSLLSDCLVRVFRAAPDTKSHDRAACAIQDVLKVVCDVSTVKIPFPSASSASRDDVWSKLPTTVQEIVHPYLTSAYSYRPPPSLGQSPIYPGSTANISFKEWISTWALSLVTKSTGERAPLLFTACKGVIKDDVDTALFLLPYLMLSVLCSDSDSDRNDVYREVMAVLTDAATCVDGKGDCAKAHPAFEVQQMCTQAVFSAFARLNDWIDAKRDAVHEERAAAQSVRKQSHVGAIAPAVAEEDVWLEVESFLRSIPEDTMALASYHCRAYARSLMHFEAYLRRDGNELEGPLQSNLRFLQRIYASLEDPDGMVGIAAIRKRTTLAERTLDHEVCGQHSAALTCYEYAAQQEPNVLQHHCGVLSSLYNLGHLETMTMEVNGLIARFPYWTGELKRYRVLSAWRTCDWDGLSEALKDDDGDHIVTTGRSATDAADLEYEMCLGRLLLYAHERKWTLFRNLMTVTRTQLITPLTAATMESGAYSRSYMSIFRLHLLDELDHGVRSLDTERDICDEPPKYSVTNWERRLDMTPQSYRVRMHLLCLRRAILHLQVTAGISAGDDGTGTLNDASDVPLDVRIAGVTRLRRELSKLWQSSATVARKACHLQVAYGALMHAEALSTVDPLLLEIEKAKLLWAKKEEHTALQALQQSIEASCNPDGHFKEDVRLSTGVKALLQCCNWMEQGRAQVNVVITQYRKAIREDATVEESYFRLGLFYCLIIETQREQRRQGQQINERTAALERALFVKTTTNIIHHIITNLALSLRFGDRFMYQALPRFLTYWLDYCAMARQISNERSSGGGGNSAQRVSKAQLADITDRCNAINATVREAVSYLPAYQFLAVFSQILSRICHPDSAALVNLELMYLKVIDAYPHQALWALVAVSKSTQESRRHRCAAVLNKAKNINTSTSELIKQYASLSTELLRLCNHPVPSNENTLSIMANFGKLHRMDLERIPILVPLQSSMLVSLPTAIERRSTHDPFQGGTQVTISGFDDRVDLLNSLQRPRKIAVIGSDGRKYIFLCKPKDDLRKDMRMMELFGLVNRLLTRNADACKRQLRIRTYAVVPLNEECGLIEWVGNTQVFRHLLMRIYRARNLYTSGKALNALIKQHRRTDKQTFFTNHLLPRFPAVFSEWFTKTFRDPASWLAARTAFSRTAAVMSIIGWIVGLGDRHGENILLDSNTGEVVHVDFNCLFNKGEKFEAPEMVPFRLTHNMVDAMGLTGYEGVFRRSCEVTYSVMRTERDSLMSILKPFIYDPLVEWGHSSNSRAQSNALETENLNAIEQTSNIEKRLLGRHTSVKADSCNEIALTVEGCVEALIANATATKNLAVMYLGWAPHC